MDSHNTPSPTEVFGRFCSLCAMAPSLEGRLVFLGEMDLFGIATAAAASIAGAASLGADADPERIKIALRQGFCDFMVNHLDEALRILKNELRRKRPVSVGLLRPPSHVAEEMLERGVQPEIVLPDQSATPHFLQRGAELLPPAPANDWIDVTWSVAEAPARWLPHLDHLAIASLEQASGPRVRWLENAPHYLRKALIHERYVRMSAKEADRFRTLLREKSPIPPLLRFDGREVNL